MSSEINGQVYLDTNINGRQDRFEAAVPGITVQLLDEVGAVMATTVTGRDGRYRFASFDETGDYQVRVVLPTRLTSKVTTRDVLISRGGLTVGGVNFGLFAARGSIAPRALATTSTPWTTATDAALTTMNTDTLTNTVGSWSTRTGRSRVRR